MRSIFHEPEIIVVEDANTRSYHDLQASQYILNNGSGRGDALNTGALHATGDILLFLHSDTQLPGIARQIQELDTEQYVYGGFYKQFSPRGVVLRIHASYVNRKLASRKTFL